MTRKVFRSCMLVTGICLWVSAVSAETVPEMISALPSQPEIQHGDIHITTYQSDMQVDQSSHYGIIDWQSFSIGSENTVHFDNGVGSTLNRVVGVDVSHIYGSLTSTGSVYLLNSNGIIIGEGGSILTGGDFVGSTLTLSNEAYLNNHTLNFVGESQGRITNLGRISSTGGNVFLSAYTIQNGGAIAAPSGRVGLATGTEIDILTDVSWGQGAYSVKVGERGNDITNEGRISGLVAELRTHNGNIFALAGNNDGLIQATGVDNIGGQVFLTADNGLIESSGEISAQVDGKGGEIHIDAALVHNYGGTQDVSGTEGGTLHIETIGFVSDTLMLAEGTEGDGGTIVVEASEEVLITSGGHISADATGKGGIVAINSGEGHQVLSGSISSTGETGGHVSLWGNEVAMLGGEIDTSGEFGGGEIYLGGGYQGEPVADNPIEEVSNSRNTYVSETSVLTADAVIDGDGGTVVAWSDGTTQFAGLISAKGGTEGGNGGLVETSGLEALGVDGTVDAYARHNSGEDGEWLLDPVSINIENTTDAFTEFQRITETDSGFGVPSDRTPSTASAGARFGQDLDMSGSTLVVGVGGSSATSFDFPSHNFLGAAYVFEDGQIAARLAPNLNSGFGMEVAIDGELIGVLDINDMHVFRKGSGWQNGRANLVNAYDVPGNNNASIEMVATQGVFYLGHPDFDVNGTSQVGAFHRCGEFGCFGTTTGNSVVGESAAGHGFERFGSHIAASDGWVYVGWNIAATRATSYYVQSPSGLNVVSTPDGSIISQSFFNGFAADGPILYSVQGNQAQTIHRYDHSEVSGGISLLGHFDVANAPGGIKGIAADNGVVLASIQNIFISSTGTFGDVVHFYGSSGGLQHEVILPQAGSDLTGVAIDGNRAAIGITEGNPTPADADLDIGTVLYLTSSNGVNWTGGANQEVLAPARIDEGFTFGADVAIDGDTIAIADANASHISFGDFYGYVYVYENGVLSAVLENGLSTAGRFFGEHLDISGDTIVIANTTGVTSTGSSISVFEKGAGWTNGTGNRTAQVGAGADHIYDGVGIDGDTIVAALRTQSGPQAGQVRIQLWSQDGLNWGSAIAAGVDNDHIARSPTSPNFSVGGFEFDGDTVLIHAAITNPDHHVHVYEYDRNDWSQVPVLTTLTSPIANPDFGRTFGISGDTIAISGLGNIYVYERITDWASAATPVATITDFNPPSIAIDGDLIVAGDAARIRFYQKGNAWVDGTANLIAEFDGSSAGSIRSGQHDSLDLSGNTLVAGMNNNPSASAFTRHAIILEGPFDLSTKNSFGNTTSLVNIAATTISNSLSRGTDVTLQAHSDITIRSAIIVDNPLGDGGTLTLEAGRSILILNDITTDNGDLNLFAKDADANPASHGGGESVVVLGKDGSNNDAILNFGTGTLVINGGDRFENRSSTTDPFVFNAAGGGRYVVYSSRPDGLGAPDQANLGKDISITGRDFLQYNTTFDPAIPLPGTLPAGSGFVYTVQPQLSVDVGGATITYGQTASAGLTLSGATVGGAALDAQGLIDFGLTGVTLTNLVDTGLAGSVPTSAGGFAHAGTHLGGLTATPKATVTTGGLFGVGVTTGAAGDLTVNKAQLSGDVDNHIREYGTADNLTITYTGFAAGDDASVLDVAPTLSSSQGIDTDVGAYVGALTASGGSDNNYDLVFTPGDLTINQKQITVTGIAGVSRVYDGTTDSGFTGTPSIDVLAGDDVQLGGTLTAVTSFADKNVGVGKPLTVTGFVITGADIANYNLSQPTTLTADITALDLSITGLTATDRVYDATTSIALGGTATISPIAGDTVSLSGTVTGNFADKNVGANKGINLSGLTLSGADAGNYTLSLSSALTASVTALDLFITGLTADNRIYDATNVASLSGTATINPLAGDVVNLGGTAVGQFDDKNVGNSKNVTVTGHNISGADAGNYNLIEPTGLTADISARDVVVTGVTADNRVYDATTDASLSGTADVAELAGDDLNVAGTPTANFDNKNVGVGKSVTVTGYTLSGADAGNYNILQPTGLTGDITQRPLTVTGLTPDNKQYDSTTNATGTGTATFGGILAGDTVTIDAAGFGFAFADKNAGSAKSIVFTGINLTGTDAGNYDSTSVDGFTADISQAPLTVDGVTAADRVYDATTDATLSGGTLNGVIAGDAVTLNTTTAASFSDKNVGNGKNVSTSGFSVSGADATNYDLTQPQGLTANITAAPLNLTGVNGDRVYDGTTDAPLVNSGFDAVFAGDVVTLDDTAVTSSFADKNVGTGKVVTITGNFALSGTDAGNYSLTQPSGVTGDITQKGITVDGLTIADKVYDGNTDGQISGTGTFGGVVAGDDVAIDVGVVNITFADKNVGEDKPVALSGITLSGADAGNYNAATPTGITGNITAKDLNVTGVTAEDKVYDRTDVATLNGAGSLDGVVAGDDVTLDESARTGAFNDKHAGEDKAVNVNGLAVNGADAGNYTLIAPQNLTADITQADVTVTGLSGGDRVYDGTTSAPVTGDAALDFGALAGVNDAGEDATLDGTATGVFDDKNVGTGKSITVEDLSLTGADKDNYNLILPTTLTGGVSQLGVSVDGVVAADKVYDGTNSASLVGVASAGTIPGDAVTLTGGDTATFSDKNVGGGKTVTVSSYNLTGADAGNYLLSQPAALSASITPAPLMVTGIVADNRPYDGTTSAPLSGTPVFSTFGSDSVSLAGQLSANFDNKNVGDNKAVAIDGISLGGPDAGNYTLEVPSLTASITPLDITLTGVTADDKVYDGNSAATLSGSPVLNLIAGDVVTFESDSLEASFAQSDVGTDISITLAGSGLSGTDAANYNLLLPFDLTADITARDLLVVNAAGVDREYDQTVNVEISGGELNDAVPGDDVTLAGSPSGQVSDPDAGTNKPVSVDGFTLSGNDAANYALSQPTDVTVDINQRQLEVTGLEIVEKFFDGNTDAVLSGGQLQGFFAGDSVNLDTSNAVATFFDASVGNDKPVEVAGLTLTGNDAANYSIDTITVLGNILAELAVITDVVPSEVLRQTAEETLEEQRQELTEFANAQDDAITLVDLTVLAPENNVERPPVIDGILDTPPEQMDRNTQSYIAAANKATDAKNTYDQVLSLYGFESRYHKSLGAEYNQAQRDLVVENAILSDLTAEIERVDVELAKVEENIATINEAKRRISEYRQKIDEATRLGRGADVEEFRQIIADAEAIVAQESDVLAQKADLEGLAAESRQRLADSEQKIADLEQRSGEILVEIDETEKRVEELRTSAARSEVEAKQAQDELEKVRAAGEAAYRDRLANMTRSKAEADASLAGARQVAESDLAARTAESIFEQDTGVIAARAASKQATEAKNTIATAISDSLGAGSLAYAQQLAAQANSAEGLQATPDQIRDGLVAASPDLSQLERDYQNALSEQAALEAQMDLVFGVSNTRGMGAILGEEIAQKSADLLQSQLDTQIAQLAGIDLSTVPKFDAGGNPISELETHSDRDAAEEVRYRTVVMHWTMQRRVITVALRIRYWVNLDLRPTRC